MSLPQPTLRQLLEAGVHFGHQKHRWNPKASPYLFGVRNGIHIIDLTLTIPMLNAALQAVSEKIAGGGRILFVGTKPQAARFIRQAAEQCAQYYINHRWFGGTLTNWKAISKSIQRLTYLKKFLDNEGRALPKKERLQLTREQDKLERAIGGISSMPGLPDMIFIIDTNKECIALNEARKLNIPVAAIIDSNSDPDGIAYPIPGNDDATRAIALYCDLIAKSALDGISRLQTALGEDVGAREDAAEDNLPEDGAPTAEGESEAAESEIEAAESEAEGESEAAESEADDAPTPEAENAASDDKADNADNVNGDASDDASDDASGDASGDAKDDEAGKPASP